MPRNPVPLPPSTPLRIVPDVHGEAGAFADCLADAARAGRFVVQLGDLVDRGPDSPGCLRLALGMAASGRGTFIRGNHEDKLFRRLHGHPVRVPPELADTLAQLEAAPDRDRLVPAFLAGYAAAPWWIAAGPLLLVHGAYHPAMTAHAAPEAIPGRRSRDKAKWLALYGEGRAGADGGPPQRTYGWIGTVPAGLTVVVGHDVRSMAAPLVCGTPAGGRAVFLDTGCGKGGDLGWLDVDPDGSERFGP